MRNWFKSAGYALEGIVFAVRTQRHMRFHVIAAAAGVAVGLFARLTAGEWLWVALSITLVWLAELFNTAVEKAVDAANPGIHPLAKAAKDTAAGAVLVTALFAVIVALVVLMPAVLRAI